MEKALHSEFGWTAGRNEKADKREGNRFRSAVHAIRQIMNGTPTKSVPDEQNPFVNAWGCAVSASSLPDCSLIF